MTIITNIASIKRRFFAYLIDIIILLIPTLFITISLKDFPLILHLSYMCVNCCYYTYFISSEAQATLGQKLMNIRTINMNNSKISLNLAFDRSISQFFLPSLNNVVISLIDFYKEHDTLLVFLTTLKLSILLLTLCWYLVAFLSHKKQTFHDILFNTIVIKVN